RARSQGRHGPLSRRSKLLFAASPCQQDTASSTTRLPPSTTDSGSDKIPFQLNDHKYRFISACYIKKSDVLKSYEITNPNLAKVGVESSNLFARSIFSIREPDIGQAARAARRPIKHATSRSARRPNGRRRAKGLTHG